MIKLKRDKRLEHHARNWAKRCVFEHSTQQFRLHNKYKLDTQENLYSKSERVKLSVLGNTTGNMTAAEREHVQRQIAKMKKNKTNAKTTVTKNGGIVTTKTSYRVVILNGKIMTPEEYEEYNRSRRPRRAAVQNGEWTNRTMELFDPDFQEVMREAVEGWAAEVEDYDYERNECKPDAVCGHYTNMVNANTQSVGCAGEHYNCNFIYLEYI